MNPSLAQRNQRQVSALVIALIALSIGVTVERAQAQEAVPWGYIPDPDSSAPPPSIGLVPGRGLIFQASEGFSVDVGSGLSYDDNQFQTPNNEFAGGIFTSDISLRYARGDRKARGVFFGGNLDIAYFDYLSEPTIGEGMIAPQLAADGQAMAAGPATLMGEPAVMPTPAQEILSQADGRSVRDGQDPFEFAYGAYIGIKGAKTTVTLSGSYSQDNGNSLNQQGQDREALRQSSENYSVGLNATRRLARGALSAGLSLQSTEYTDRLEERLAMEDSGAVLMGEPQVPVGGITDQTSWSGNVGWSHQPVATPKTAFNLGVSFGASEQDGGTEESNVSPSIGVNYRYSPKTSFFGNVGMDFRRSESTTTTTVPVEPAPVVVEPAPAPGVVATPAPVVAPPPPMVVTEQNSFDSASPTFAFGASWSPTPTTRLGISVSQSTNSSSIQGQSSYESRSVTITGTKQFQRGYYASLDYSLENTSYTNNAGVEDSSPGRVGTPEDYSRFGFSVGRQVQLRPNVALNMSAFYQHNVGSGEDVLSEFEQNISGIRVGLSF